MDRLLLVDDDLETVGTATRFLGYQGFEVEWVTDPEQAVAFALSGKYALVILNTSGQIIDGLEILRRVRIGSPIPVLMVAGSLSDSSRILGLENGADDCLLKPVSLRELAARVRAILRRTSLRTGSVPRRDWLSIDDLQLDTRGWVVRCAAKRMELTTLEFQLLETLLRSAGQVLTREELVHRVLGRHFNPADRSIDMHISHLRRKLGPGSDGQDRIRTIRGVGYIYLKPGKGRSAMASRSAAKPTPWTRKDPS